MIFFCRYSITNYILYLFSLSFLPLFKSLKVYKYISISLNSLTHFYIHISIIFLVLNDLNIGESSKDGSIFYLNHQLCNQLLEAQIWLLMNTTFFHIGRTMLILGMNKLNRGNLSNC